MDVDPLEPYLSNDDSDSAGKAGRLTATVAITVALLATFLGVCKVKDDNIVQAMQQAQADKLDHWAYYQARNIREQIARSTATLLRLQESGNATPANAQARAEAIDQSEKTAADQSQKKEELLKQAEQDQKNYNALNFHDDQFDLSDAALAIAIALLAITALTRYWVLYFAALIPSCFGVVLGLAGLLGWQIHPDGLVRLLT